MSEIFENMGAVESTYPVAAEAANEPVLSFAEELKKKYGKVYEIGATIEVDDETTLDLTYYFKRPSTASYDRYVKSASQSATKALKTFLFDNVVSECESKLMADLEEYPAMSLSIGEKLLGMLGLSKQTNLKML